MAARWKWEGMCGVHIRSVAELAANEPQWKEAMVTDVLEILMLKIWVTHQVKELGQLSSWPSMKKAWAASESYEYH